MIYRYLIDPMLNSSHACASSLVNAKEKVLDVACGNGTLALLIQKKLVPALQALIWMLIR